jgi:hypothetical protein
VWRAPTVNAVRVGERTSDRSLGGAKLVGSSVCHRAVLRGVAGVEPVTPSKPYSCGWVAGMLRAAAAAAAQRRMIWREASRSRLPSTKPQAGAVRQIQGQGKNQGQFRNSPQFTTPALAIGRIPIDVTADVRMEPLHPLRAARCASQRPRRDRPALLLICEKRSVSEGRSFELHHGAHHGRIRRHRGAGVVRAGAVRALESCSDVGGLELHHGAHHGRIRPHRGAGVVRAGAVRALESCSDVGGLDGSHRVTELLSRR